MVGARFYGENTWSGWLGAIFLEKRLVSRVGHPSWDIQKPSLEFLFTTFEYCSYIKVAILGSLCGGAL